MPEMGTRPRSIAFASLGFWAVVANKAVARLDRGRWVVAADGRKLEEFMARAHDHLARDHKDALVYLAPSRINLQLTLERWPELTFRETREHAL